MGRIGYCINYLQLKLGFYTSNAVEGRTKRNLILLMIVYAVTLFIGTTYILWQYLYLFNIGLFPFNFIGKFSFANCSVSTYSLNLVIQLVVCPALLRAVTPKLKSWGVYSGNFAEWRSRRAKAQSNPFSNLFLISTPTVM